MAEIESAPIDLVNFLESIPPGRLISVADIVSYEGPSSHPWIYLKKPDIQLHCENDACQGLRFFTTNARMPRSVNGDEWLSDLRGCEGGQPAPFDRPSFEMPRLVGGEFHLRRED